MIEGRSEETRLRMARAITEAISATLEAPVASIRVIVTEVPAQNWIVGGKAVRPRTAG